MVTNKQDLSLWKGLILIFNGQRHDYKDVLTQALLGPEIAVQLNEICMDTDPLNSFLSGEETAKMPIVLYKHGLQYHVFGGLLKLQAAIKNKEEVVRARFISKPSLKKARIVVEQPAPPAAMPSPNWPASARNSPYIRNAPPNKPYGQR